MRQTAIAEARTQSQGRHRFERHQFQAAFLQQIDMSPIRGTRSSREKPGVNEIYNPAANTWTTGVAIPTPRYVPASAVVNGILYVMGGIGDSSQTPLNVMEAPTHGRVAM